MSCSPVAAIGLGAAVLLAGAAPAQADHCDPVVLAPRTGAIWTASVRGEAARFSNRQAQGNWLGLRGELGAGLGAFHLRGWVPVYSLTRGGDRREGLGDVGLAGQWRAAGEQSGGRWALGPSLAVTAPTGAAADGLGMGHAMAMPGAWWSLGSGALRGSGVLAYGRALSSHAEGHEHHHGGPTGSLVDPMNRSELMASSALGWWFATSLRAELAALAAEPLPASEGVRRVRGGLALAWGVGAFEVAGGLELPLVGDFFQVRSHLTISARN
jgi:hypothetical protein